MVQGARTRPAVREGGSRVHWITAGVLALAALLGWAYVASRPQTARVVRRDIVVALPLEGKVVAPPLARADIGAPYAAPVARVYASVGERVKRGDVLVELSHPSAQAAYEQARSEVAAAAAALADARRQGSAALDAARQDLDAARAAERAARQAAAPTPAGEVTITEPAQSLSDATATRIAAEQAVLQAEADQAATLAPYRQRVESARAQLKEAQSGRKQAMIRSPLAGTLLALNAQPGQTLPADGKTPIATIVDLEKLQVHAPMSADEADGVKPGATAWLQLRDLKGERFEGKVQRVTTQPRGSLGTGDGYVALITFENTQGMVKPDMAAAVSIKLGAAENAIAVPSEAVDRDDSGRPVVTVLRDGRWQKVVVDPGLSDGRMTAIRDGLAEEETIRVTPDIL